LNEHFIENIFLNDQKAYKKMCSLFIREMQIKTTIRYHFMPIRMVSIINEKTTDNLNCW
jgi:hypothetical protein